MVTFGVIILFQGEEAASEWMGTPSSASPPWAAVQTEARPPPLQAPCSTSPGCWGQAAGLTALPTDCHYLL